MKWYDMGNLNLLLVTWSNWTFGKVIVDILTPCLVFVGLHGHILNFSFTSKIKDLLQMKKNCEPSTSIHLYEVSKLFLNKID